MKVRKSILVICGLTLALAGGIMVRNVWFSASKNNAGSSTKPLTAEEERERRTSAVIEVAPAPLPKTLPLIGDKEAVGPDGYPTAYVDRAALRSLLWHQRFDDLTRYLTEFEDAYEANPRCEQWANDAAEAFATADPSLREPLNRWVSASAGSFTSLVARGVYTTHVGIERRGGKWAADTAQSDFRSMGEAFIEARRDLDAALVLRPRLTVALRNLIRIAATTGAHAEQTRLVERAHKACPTCFLPLATFLSYSTPRWGGTYEAMTQFANAADSASNPRLRWLQGYVDNDRADLARQAKDYSTAEAAIDRALAYGDNWQFLAQRAKVRVNRDDKAGALGDLDRALAVRPDEPDLLFRRAFLLAQLKRWEEAAVSLLAGLRINATGDVARDTYNTVLKGLDWQAWQYAKEGRRDDAMRLYELAMDLAPTDMKLLHRRATVILGKDPDIASLEDAVAKDPDDFRAHLSLDYALSQKRDWTRIEAIWTRYIERHPDDARAYLERCGTYKWMNRPDASLADCAKACELGSNSGCAIEKRQRSSQSAPQTKQ